MKFNFENGLPVWVWGIAFLLLVLPFSFRPNSDSAQFGPNVEGENSMIIDQLPTAEPTPPLPAATEAIIIEIAPPPSDGYPEPEEPEIEPRSNEGYE